MEARTIAVPDGLSAEAPAGESQTELTAALERIRRLIETSAVDEARALAKEMGARWPEDERAQYWARVLAPPRGSVVKGVRSRSLDRERAWLREHAQEYPGQWLAIFGDQLVAADPSLATVLKTVRETPGAETAALYYQTVSANQQAVSLPHGACDSEADCQSALATRGLSARRRRTAGLPHR
jgi:hypothetical protein